MFAGDGSAARQAWKYLKNLGSITVYKSHAGTNPKRYSPLLASQEIMQPRKGCLHFTSKYTPGRDTSGPLLEHAFGGYHVP